MNVEGKYIFPFQVFSRVSTMVFMIKVDSHSKIPYQVGNLILGDFLMELGNRVLSLEVWIIISTNVKAM